MAGTSNQYSSVLRSMLGGGASRQFESAAQTSALQNAMAAGMSNPSISPALAARQAQQAAAQTSASAAAQAAQMRLQEQAQGANMAFRQQQADQARLDKFIGMGVGALGSGLAMLSDERSKADIQPAGQAVDRMMGAVDPATFQYREGTPEAGQERAGVMAQDLAQTTVGRTMLRRDPQTGMQAVDQQSALSALLAATARLHDRLSALEGSGKE